MNLQTHPVQTVQLINHSDNGWSDNYSAFRIAAKYAGLEISEPYSIRGVWVHGCDGPWYATTPKMWIYGASFTRSLPVYTAREDQAEQLKADGYGHARAISLPILYAPASGLPRVPRSLLVMPCHTLNGARPADRSLYLAYANEIKAVAGRFDRVVACVHPNCKKNGLWVQEFTSVGIEVIYGAQPDDLNSLPRMRSLFEQFETVTTNDWGSHVAYALTFGCKVSIYGTFPMPTLADFMLDSSWRNNPIGLQQALSSESVNAKWDFLKKLRVLPTDAVADQDMGDYLVGANSKISPDEMREVLRLLIDPKPLEKNEPPPGRLLCVLPDTNRTNANLEILTLLRWLKRERSLSFDIVVGKPGVLHQEFHKVSTIFIAGGASITPARSSSYRLVLVHTLNGMALLDKLGISDLPVWTYLSDSLKSLDNTPARALARVLGSSQRLLVSEPVLREALVNRYAVDTCVVDSWPAGLVDLVRLKEASNVNDVNELRSSLGIAPDAALVVFCDVPDLVGGADLFPQFVRALRDRMGPDRALSCVWIGGFTSAEHESVLNRDLRIMGLERMGQFVGEHAKAQTLIAAADVFCLASRRDNLTLPAIEAAAMARPVVKFIIPGASETEAAFCKNVPYIDITAMAEYVHALLINPGLATKAAEASVQHARALHSLENAARDIYSRVAEMLGSAPCKFSKPDYDSIYATWKTEGHPHAVYIQALDNFNKIAAQAFALVRAGKKNDAIRALIRAAQGAVAYKDPYAVAEVLFGVAEALKSLEPKKSTVLMDEAKKYSRVQNLSPDGLGAFTP